MFPQCVLMVNTQTCWDSNLTSKYPVTSCHRSFTIHFPLRISLCMNHLHWYLAEVSPEKPPFSELEEPHLESDLEPLLCDSVDRVTALTALHTPLKSGFNEINPSPSRERHVIICYLAGWAASMRGSIIPFCCTWPCGMQPCALYALVWHAEAHFCFQCR